jgi:hypothetical protein
MGDAPQGVLDHDVLRANYERSFDTRSPGRGAASMSARLGHVRNVRYGVGFTKTVVNGHIIIGHDGDVAGYSALALFDPDRHIGIICFRNSNDETYRKVAIKALVSMLGE